MNPVLHTYHDGSRLCIMSAKTLISIPIWKGNRIKDMTHIKSLKETIGTDVRKFDKGYHIIKYKEPDASGALIEQAYIIDGQHRASVLDDFFKTYLCEPDFDVTFTEIHVENEAEAIAYFNKINNVKPIIIKEEPVLVVNRYLEQIVKKFPGTKTMPLFRDKHTKRPFLETDRLRKSLLERIELLKIEPEVFSQNVFDMNSRIVRDLEILVAQGKISEKDQSIAERSIELKFALAFDTKLNWIDKVLDVKN